MMASLVLLRIHLQKMDGNDKLAATQKPPLCTRFAWLILMTS
jgi:hypothetical protein